MLAIFIRFWFLVLYFWSVGLFYTGGFLFWHFVFYVLSLSLWWVFIASFTGPRPLIKIHITCSLALFQSFSHTGDSVSSSLFIFSPEESMHFSLFYYVVSFARAECPIGGRLGCLALSVSLGVLAWGSVSDVFQMPKNMVLLLVITWYLAIQVPDSICILVLNLMGI